MIADFTSSKLLKSGSRLLAAAALAVCSVTVHAALLARDINGDSTVDAYYDTALNITWLANWNANGLMNWTAANTWAAGLNVFGVTGWRLPTTNTGPSSNCSSNFDPGAPFPLQYFGSNCTGSEMGHVWYTELGNTAGALTNTGPFINMQSFAYWSGTEYAPDPVYAWTFLTFDGFQVNFGKVFELSAVAVRPGDVAAAVAEPGSLAILLAGLGALAVARRRRPD